MLGDIMPEQYKYSVFPDQPQYPELKLELPLMASPYTIKIIDLSYHQRPESINYDELAKQADGFILRASYGIGVPGKWQGTDPAFNKHYEELCVKRGKPCGAYHYIVAYESISDQVTVMKNAVAGKKLRLGMWCDVELEKGADPLKAEHVIAYMTEAEARIGKFEGIYNGHWCWMDIMGEHEAAYSHKKLWMSVYTASPDNYIPHGWDKWWLWQYTSLARLPGYYGNLDVSYFYGDRQAFDNWIGDNMILDIAPLSQIDPRWKNIRLGTSSSTIGSHGCLITGITMMLNHLGLDIDPARLNEWLVANGGYSKGNLFVWGSVARLLKGLTFAYRYNGAYLDKIDEQLALKMPAIVHVDYNPLTPYIDEHWIAVIGKQDGSYIVNDPRNGNQFKFESMYGAPSKGIFHVCTYNFVASTEPGEEEDMLFEVKVKISDLVIRSGPGKLYPVVYRYASGVYGILEVKKDAFSGMEFGRIDTNKWICIDPNYVEKIGDTPTNPDLETRVTNLEARVTVLEKG